MRSTRMLLDGLVFPEGPRWYQDRLWFSDMDAHRVWRTTEWGHSEIVAEFPDKPSGIGFLPDGTPIVVLMRTRRIVRFGAGIMSVHADLSTLPGTHLNDMVVGPRGYAYVGSRNGDARGRTHRSPGAAGDTQERSPESLVLVRPDGTHDTVAEDLWAPNGMAIAPDARTLIVAETLGNRLTAFTIDDDGSLRNRRVFAELSSRPDGICLDREGAVWVGAVLANEFLRVREGGVVLDRIALPNGKWAVACVLGGTDRQTLFMLTAYNTFENLDQLTTFDADMRSTSRGFVDTIEVEVPGAGWP